MSSSSPLTGLDLVDCAKANAASGSAIAAKQCGYGSDIATFRDALKSACSDMGVDVESVSDLITDQQSIKTEGGIEVAPDTPADL